MRIEKIDYDDILQLRVGYGGIKTCQTLGNEGEKWTNGHICAKCGIQRQTTGGVKVNISRGHNELQLHYDRISPCCPGECRTLQSLNRHIRNPICGYIKGVMGGIIYRYI